MCFTLFGIPFCIEWPILVSFIAIIMSCLWWLRVKLRAIFDRKKLLAIAIIVIISILAIMIVQTEPSVCPPEVPICVP